MLNSRSFGLSGSPSSICVTESGRYGSTSPARCLVDIDRLYDFSNSNGQR